MSPQFLLVLAVAGVGVLHTIVPDHWLPIALIARQEGWTRRVTARAAFGAGVGHSLSTLALGVLVWLLGAAAASLGQTVSGIASAALIGFGLWVAVTAFREARRPTADDGPQHGHGAQGHPHTHGAHGHPHGHDHSHSEPSRGHRHSHRHPDGRAHTHYHTHPSSAWHEGEGALALAGPVHEHDHRTAPRRTLLLILGSSPMVEGIPAFFAAGRFGPAQLVLMAVVFTLATTATYVTLCVSSAAALERIDLGPLEGYGEVLSGAFIALVGLVFLWIGV